MRAPGTEPAPRGDLGRLWNSDRGHDLRGHLRGLPRGQRGPQRPQQRGRLLSGGFVGEAAGAHVEVAGAHRARAREVAGGGVGCGSWRRGIIGHGVMVTALPLARLWSWPAPLLPTGRCCPARTAPPPALAEHRPRSAGLPRGPAGPRVASTMKALLCCGPPRSGAGRCGAQPRCHPFRRTAPSRIASFSALFVRPLRARGSGGPDGQDTPRGYG